MSTQLDEQDPKSGPKGSSFGFGTVVRGLRRYPLIAFLVVIAAAFTAAAVWLFLPLPKMTAYSIFHISAQPRTLLDPVGEARADFTYYRQAQSALVKSTTVLNAALNDKKELADVTLLPQGPDKLGWLQSKLIVDFKASPEFMRIALEGDQPDQILSIIKAVTTAYKDKVSDKDKQSRKENWTQLTDYIRITRENLNSKRRQLRDDGPIVPDKPPTERWGTVLNDLLIQAGPELLRSQSEVKILDEKVKKTEKFVVPDEWTKTEIKNDPGYQQRLGLVESIKQRIQQTKDDIVPGARPAILLTYEKDLAEASKELDAYSKKKSPEIEARLKELATADAKQSLAKAQDRFGMLTAWQKTLANEIATLPKEQPLALAQNNLDSLRADIATKEKSLERAQQLLESMEPDLNAPSRVTLWEDPAVMLGIEGNRRLKYAALAGGAVLLLGLGWITFLEARNRRVITTQEVSGELGLKLIGTVPAMPRHSGRALGARAPQSDVWESMLTESVDATRAVLLHSLVATKVVRTLMVSSALPGEGKTMLACNLAASLARAGLKTLLLDGDLRRPNVHRFLDMPRTPGLCELLRGNGVPQRAIQETGIPGLSFVPAGVWDERVRQGLSGDRWRTLMAQLETGFDCVVIDSSPLLLVADPLLVARNVDGVVMSVLRNVSQIDAVAAARDRLASLGIKVLGVVVNGFDGPMYRDALPYYQSPSPAELPSITDEQTATV